MSANKVILIGNLGADPEVRYMQSGDAIASIRLATTDRYRDKQSGQTKELTEWHRVSFYGRLAEVVKEYTRKGSQIYVEGKLRTRKWQAQDGTDRYTTEIAGLTLKLLGRPPGDRGDTRGQRNEPPNGSSHSMDDDDIPF